VKLIAQMVGRNEAGRFLPDVLEHMKSFVDVIVFNDDASTDDTPEIARSAGAHVYLADEQRFNVNEGQLRQWAWNNLSKHAEVGDWILAIDCDEKLWMKSSVKSLDSLLKQPDYDVISIDFYHMWSETQYRSDKLWAPHPSSRLFKYYLGGRFHDRKLACGSEPLYVRTLINRRRYLRDSGLMMQHLGYVRDEDKQAKWERYMTLDGGDFHAKKHIESIIDPNPTLVDWSAAHV